MTRKSLRRHFLKDKEVKKLIQEFSRRFNLQLTEILEKDSIEVEVAEVGADVRVFLISGRPLLVSLEERLVPSLVFEELFRFLPRVVVDSGAVPYVCNGADVMAPGIVRVEGNFHKGDIVVVVDERHAKPLVIGEALHSSEELRKMKTGKAVKNVHYVGDKRWKFIKEIS